MYAMVKRCQICYTLSVRSPYDGSVGYTDADLLAIKELAAPGGYIALAEPFELILILLATGLRSKADYSVVLMLLGTEVTTLVTSL